MSNVKLPDLDRLDAVKERMKDLPPQVSVDDTSNWEERNITAPVIDMKTGEYTTRNLDFMSAKGMDDSSFLTPEQVRKLSRSSKKASK